MSILQGASRASQHDIFFHKELDPVAQDSEGSASAEDMSAEEEEVASSLIELQQNPLPASTPTGRPKRCKRKRFDSDDYVFEDDKMAQKEATVSPCTCCMHQQRCTNKAAIA